MMKLNINLAKTNGEPYGDLAPIQIKESEVYYPEFTFYEDGPPKFPDEGTMVIRYKKIRSSVDEKARKGRRYSCTLEVREIVSAEGEKESAESDAPSKRDTRTGDALDKLAAERSKKDESEDY